jgi:hypothetical protein
MHRGLRFELLSVNCLLRIDQVERVDPYFLDILASSN